MQPAKVKYSIKYKLILLSVVVVVPFLVMVLYLIYALHNYSRAYDAIVGNMTVANNYNLNFKEEMDESLYKLVVGSVTFDTVGNDGSLVDPYEHLDELRGEFNNLMSITTDDESRVRLQILLRNIDTLEDRVDDIRTNLETDAGYDANIEMLDNNIYILTELIQDNIQSYIYYQTKSMEYLTSQLNVRVHSFTLFCGVLLTLLLFMVAILIVMIVTDIIRPIRELSRVTEQVAEGDFSARAEVETQDEVAVLADSVNLMTESLEGLVTKIKEDERKMRKADLRLLQEQINPHFLYNTLDSLYWKATESENDEIAEDILSLSQLFRLVLNRGDGIVTVQTEADLLERYLHIQKMRFGKRLTYEISIDRDILEEEIPKLILQPFVENAIVHGFESTEGSYTLSVTGIRKEKKMIFRIRDTGVGMSGEQLEAIWDEADTRKYASQRIGRYAIRNVRERLKLIYRENYELKIESSVGCGTTVRIVVPCGLREIRQNEH